MWTLGSIIAIGRSGRNKTAPGQPKDRPGAKLEIRAFAECERLPSASSSVFRSFQLTYSFADWMTFSPCTSVERPVRPQPGST